MRLLHTGDIRIQDFSAKDVPTYAILSHTWGYEEVTFQDLESQRGIQMEGYLKLQNFCQKAAADGYEWGWMDTCCIDKSSSAELSEAINSMYSFYSNAAVCYAYMADVQTLEDLEKSKWFTRGWTLQELIAPRSVILFDSLWRELGSKGSLLKLISLITGIPQSVVAGRTPNSCNIAQRMSWASTRQTTRDEDMAYSLLGLFDVHMSPIYGEGLENAYLRLQQQILRQNADQTLFLWTPSHEPYNLGLLANSPKAFCRHHECFSWLPGYEAAAGKPFDMYSLFRPSSLRPSVRSVDQNDMAKNVYDDSRNHHDFPESLGSRGLHISLLLNAGIPGHNIKTEDLHLRVVCFDMKVSGLDNNAYVCLVLQQDMEFDYSSTSIPNQLGKWRRMPCTESASRYTLHCPGFSFERTATTISQITTGAREPGRLATFIFHNQETRALVGDVMLLQAGSPPTTLSGLPERFDCNRGVLSIRHPCRKCDDKGGNILAFGVNGRNSDPWCCFVYKKADQLTGQSNMDMYQQIELMNSRFSGTASHYMVCDQRAMAGIQPTADEGCYSIQISLFASDNHFRSYPNMLSQAPP